MNALQRAVVGVAALALVGWVALGIYHAGGDVPPPPGMPQTKLGSGHAEGRRINGEPSWSLDYDRIVASPDTTLATLENVRHGEIYKHGKPYMRLTAKHVVVNTLSNDFDVMGPFVLSQDDGKRKRRLTSDAASYSGVLQTLTLSHPAKINDEGATVTVATATVNFKSGDMHFGPLVGLF